MNYNYSSARLERLLNVKGESYFYNDHYSISILKDIERRKNEGSIN